MSSLDQIQVVGDGGSAISCIGDPYYLCSETCGYSYSGADPHESSVVLSLCMNGAAGSTDIVDSSPYGIVPTVVGSGALRTNDWKFGGASWKGEASSYFQVILGSNGLLTGDFTLEYWAGGGAGGTLNAVHMYSTSGGGYIYNNWFQDYGGPNLAMGATTLSAGEWAFFAISRTGSTIKAYRNGVLQGTQTYAGTIDLQTMQWGRFVPNNNLYWNGHIDDIRITKGVGRYPNSCPVPEAKRTVLSIHADADPLTDFSCYQTKTLTLTGIAQISDVQAMFGGKSILVPNVDTSTLNGLVVTDHQDFDFGTGDFTIDLWAYRSANTYVGTLFYGTLGGGEFSVKVGTDGLIDLIYRSSGGSQSFTDVATWPVGQWVYFVIQRRGTNWETYLDGALIHSAAITGGAGSTVNSTSDLFFGRTNASSAQSWNGYLDDIRVTRGAARYANPNLLTAAFPDSAPADPHWANVVLMLHCDGADGSTTLIDSSSSAVSFSVAGNARIETDQAKFGGASAYIPDTNAGWSAANYDGIRFGTGDFTVEFWLWRTGASSGDFLFLAARDTGSNDQWSINMNAADLAFMAGNTTYANITPISKVPANQWNHIAFCRSGTTISGFVNGIPSSTGPNTLTNNLNGSASLLRVGNNPDFSGFVAIYLDDIRITKGVARYPSSETFTPPALTFCERASSVAAEVAGTLQGRVLKLTQGLIGSVLLPPNWYVAPSANLTWGATSGTPRWVEWEFQPTGEIWVASSDNPTLALRVTDYSFPYSAHYWGLPATPGAGAEYELELQYGDPAFASELDLSGVPVNTRMSLATPRRFRITNFENYAHVVYRQLHARIWKDGVFIAIRFLDSSVEFRPSPVIAKALQQRVFEPIVLGVQAGQEAIRTLTLNPDGTITTNPAYGADARPPGLTRWLQDAPHPGDGAYYNVQLDLAGTGVMLSGELSSGQVKRMDTPKTVVFVQATVFSSNWSRATFQFFTNKYHDSNAIGNSASYTGRFELPILAYGIWGTGG